LADFALTKSKSRTIVNQMEERGHDDVAERSFRYTREQFDEILSQTETYVRENPAQSLAYAVLAGFVLNRLGIGRILRGVVRLALFALKPAILIYGAAKLYEAAQEKE
jgi:ElaB/YqjD/DUF883 family membrane-anchored ribosome-binding protein